MPSGSSTQPANQSPDVPATASLNTDEPLPQPRHRAPRSLTLHPNQGVWRVHSVSRVRFPFPLKCHSGVIMPAVNCAHSTRKAALHLSGLTQKPGAGLCRTYSSPGGDSRPGRGFCAAARMGQRGRAIAPEPGLRDTDHVHFCKTALALRGAWILLKANGPVSRALGKACCCAPL